MGFAEVEAAGDWVVDFYEGEVSRFSHFIYSFQTLELMTYRSMVCGTTVFNNDTLIAVAVR